LRELRSGLAKEFREYIASPEGGAEYVMHCDSHSCGYYFEYLDLPVNVYFNATLLSNWRKIHQKTLSLLNGMRKD
jgi:alpha-D-ribose 1-methylphosphonate 5-triphosphate synthase subunit PhnI